MSTKEFKKPEVGQDCTMAVGSDRYPFRIIKVTKSGKTFWMKSLDARRIDKNGMSESQTYVYCELPEGLGEIRRVFWRRAKNRTGWYSDQHCPVGVGHAEMYQDPSF